MAYIMDLEAGGDSGRQEEPEGGALAVVSGDEFEELIARLDDRGVSAERGTGES